MIMMLLVQTALAYETDQLTRRDEPLEDALPVANTYMDGIVADAVAATNERLECEADPDRTRAVLAREIRDRTAKEQLLPHKGLLRSPGYGRYQALLETGPVDRREFLERTDIYAGLSLLRSVVLKVAGTCSTVRLAGGTIGTDKVDHFFGEGFEYFRRSRNGRDPDRAIRWGTNTERTIYGLMTSNTFSYADLAANFDGYTFYAGLLREGSVVELDTNGCATVARGWDWHEWVDEDWDEVLNPNVYTRGVQRAVAERLEQERDAVCASTAEWADSTYEERLQTVLTEPPPYAAPNAPPRTDPFQLSELCEPTSVSVTDASE